MCSNRAGVSWSRVEYGHVNRLRACGEEFFFLCFLVGFMSHRLSSFTCGGRPHYFRHWVELPMFLKLTGLLLHMNESKHPGGIGTASEQMLLINNSDLSLKGATQAKNLIASDSHKNYQSEDQVTCTLIVEKISINQI